MPDKNKIWVSSLVAARNQKPAVDIVLDDIHVQLDAAAAVQFGQQIIETALAAYADGFVFNFIFEKVTNGGVDGKELAAHVMADFRDYRDKLEREFKG